MRHTASPHRVFPASQHRLRTLPAWRIIALLIPMPLMAFNLNPHQTSQAAVSAPQPGTRGSPFAAVPPTSADCASPANPIVAENCQPGTTAWQINNFNATYWQVNYHDIEGFGSTSSLDRGSSISFYVNTDAAHYDLLIFRSGYYGGTGGRLVTAIRDLPGQKQPACQDERVTGLVSCSNWLVSYRLTIPLNWASGIYLAKLVRSDTGGENYVLFVVRNDARQAEILYQLSIFTYQAYNYYSGKSLYSVASYDQCLTVAQAPRAVKVSFDRPYAFPTVSFYNNYFFADYPMVYWLESQGYDVGYSADIDTHYAGESGHPNTLRDHRVFLVVGHGEYWSQEMRDAVAGARDSGVHLGFFSSNVSYWRIRLEPDPWSSVPDRVLVSYKTTESGPPDPTGQPTGTWRDPSGANDPENSLIGVQYVGENDAHYFPLRITAEMASDRIYRNTGLQEMPPGTYAEIGTDLVGWEWDAVANNGHTPAGLSVLAESPAAGPILASSGARYDLGTAVAQTTRYVAASGAIVFASGTNLWSWGLALHAPDPRLQQITYNLLADMHVQPATPAATLVLDQSQPTTTGTRPSVNFYPIQTGRAPLISSLQAVATDTAVTISWVTDGPSDGQVWVKGGPGQINWGIYSELTSIDPPIAGIAVDPQSANTHSVTVGSLRPGTTYSFQVAASDAGRRTTLSPDTSFQTKTGSFSAQVEAVLRPAYRAGTCWYRSNPSQKVSLVWGLLALGSLVAAWLAFATRRQWKAPRVFRRRS